MNANYKTLVPRHSMIVVVFLASALSGCGRQDPQAHSEPVGDALSPEPLVIAPSPAPAPGTPAPQYEMESDAAKSAYAPDFAGGQLVAITEKRVSEHGVAHARYEFQGARLLRYSGASFEADGQMEIEFSLQGAVISATRGAQEVSQQEIAQARAHAQLLRSHALAQQATRSHNLATSH